MLFEQTLTLQRLDCEGDVDLMNSVIASCFGKRKSYMGLNFLQQLGHSLALHRVPVNILL